MNKLLREQKIIYVILGLILLAHILILTKLIYFPYPELFIYPYLTNHGLKPYSQILDQHFPGLMFLPINFDNLGMNTPEVARFWSIFIIIAVQIMLFLIGSEILKSKRRALLINVLFLAWQPFFEGWVLWIDSFLPLFLLPAFYSFHKRRFFITGLLLGTGIVFKQVLIPLAGLTTIYIIWQERNLRATLIFLLGLFSPIALVLIYFAGIGVLRDFWYWTVVFNLTTFAKFGTKAPPSIGFITRVILIYGLSFIALFNRDRKLVSILFIFIVGSLAGIFDRADFVHFQPALPFVLIATVWGFSALWNKKTVKLILLIYILIGIWWLNIFYKGHLGDRVISFDSNTKSLAAKIRNYASPGEKIFIFGAVPHLYQMSATLPAGDIFIFPFPWFLKVSQNRILEGIMRDKPEIIVSDRTVIIEGAKIIDFASDIDQYIGRNYQKIDSVGTTDILRRKN